MQGTKYGQEQDVLFTTNLSLQLPLLMSLFFNSLRHDWEELSGWVHPVSEPPVVGNFGQYAEQTYEHFTYMVIPKTGYHEKQRQTDSSQILTYPNDNVPFYPE